MPINIGPGIKIGTGVTITTPPMTATAFPAAKTASTNFAITPFVPLVGRGGSNVYTYYVSSGTLPAGLTLNANTGVVSGTPTVVYPTASVQFSVRDSVGYVSSVTSSVSFNVGASIFATVNTNTAQVLEVGLAMNAITPLSVTGGVAPYTHFVSAGTLPAGLTLNTSTGQVSGTPTTQQSLAAVTFSVQDANGATAANTSTIDFTVYPTITASAQPSTQSLTSLITITPFTPLTAANGTGIYTYFVSSGVLPSGLTLNPSTGQVSGTPNQSYPTANVVFSVRDSFNVVATTTSTVSFYVFAPPVSIQYLVVAGGGGGGGGSVNPYNGAGGGGAGGMIALSGFLDVGTTYTITVGGGGSGGGARNYGSDGGTSAIVGISTATGGGGGGGGPSLGGSAVYPGRSGGSGGGGGGGPESGTNPASSVGRIGGLGGTGAPGQGNTGGTGGAGYYSAVAYQGGGGGGGGKGSAGGTGGSASPSSGGGSGGVGGSGAQWPITGTIYAGGGGGGGSGPSASSPPSAGPGGSGGAGGGGSGAGRSGAASAGTANTGGGGGAGEGYSNTSGAPGGSGVVIIAVPTTYTLTAPPAAPVAAPPAAPGQNVVTFRASGTFRVNNP